MKTTRQYLAKCHNCNGTGIDYKQIDGYNTSAVCIVCNGAKVITVTETIEDTITTEDLKAESDACDAHHPYYDRNKLMEHQ